MKGSRECQKKKSKTCAKDGLMSDTMRVELRNYSKHDKPDFDNCDDTD